MSLMAYAIDEFIKERWPDLWVIGHKADPSVEIRADGASIIWIDLGIQTISTYKGSNPTWPGRPINYHDSELLQLVAEAINNYYECESRNANVQSGA